jgi:opacity protein-like surface antigen
MQLIVKNILVGAVLAVAALATAADAPDPVVGTWALNVAQSKFTSGHELKSQTRTYTESAKGVSVKVSGVAADGSSQSQQSTFKYDGKSYPMSGAADYDAISLQRINDNTVKSTLLKSGKPVGVTIRTISMHGKVMTLSTKLKDVKGQRNEMIAVYHKQ